MIDVSETERKEIEKRNKNRVDRLAEDIRRVLSLVEGRRYLSRLLINSCATDDNLDLIETSFNPNNASMNFTEGSRRFGISIYNEIMKASPQTMIQMRREAADDKRMETKKDE